MSWDGFPSLPPIPEQRENPAPAFAWEKSAYQEAANRTAARLENSDCESLDSSLSSEGGERRLPPSAFFGGLVGLQHPSCWTNKLRERERDGFGKRTESFEIPTHGKPTCLLSTMGVVVQPL